MKTKDKSLLVGGYEVVGRLGIMTQIALYIYHNILMVEVNQNLNGKVNYGM